MTVSGLGTSHTPFPTIAPHSAPAPAARPERADRPRTGFDQLTESDRALIEHVTGQRITPGFDPAAEPVTAFAATLAGERAADRLSPGQEVTPVYLKDLDRRLRRTGRNPIGPHLAKAVGFLQGAGPSHFDVSA
jgi:hypothetical protein